MALTHNRAPLLSITTTPWRSYHGKVTLGDTALYYNPHSRSLAAAPRFSPTRFIPLAILRRYCRDLIATMLWGIKRYTLAGQHGWKRHVEGR